VCGDATHAPHHEHDPNGYKHTDGHPAVTGIRDGPPRPADTPVTCVPDRAGAGMPDRADDGVATGQACGGGVPARAAAARPPAARGRRRNAGRDGTGGPAVAPHTVFYQPQLCGIVPGQQRELDETGTQRGS